ncbi:DUF1214 domain-containing protein [Rhizobium leguminosarum]|uniref:DUF1214 domain-containing protein n=1 Tax=Rhizobium leguminosarum TaxID=384 RepID=UPI0028C4BB8A|nr:DUF1214 domain-containing protein [Rhizobium leguminosarum]
MRPHAPALPLLLASPADAQEAHDAVNEAKNPLTPEITINLQDYYSPSFINTPGEPEANQFLLRGLIPSDMFALLQLLRSILPIATSPDVPSGYVTGIGDLTLMDLFILPKHGDVTLGAGPLLVVPTATDEKWDQASQNKIRKALIELGTTLTDTSRSFGTKDQVDPIQHLISAATTRGGNPRRDAIYLNFTPPNNDGTIVHKLHVGKVPVDGFWSISLYNADGHFQKNDLNAYSLNNITAKNGADGSTDIQFGGCDGKVTNCLRIMSGWNDTVRLYRPHAEILDGKWTFPEPVVVQ